MLDDATKLHSAEHALQNLTFDGLRSIAESSFGVEGCKGAIAYFDQSKDQLITTLTSFNEAVKTLERFPNVQTQFGAAEAPRLATQFVFNTCRAMAQGCSWETAFAQVWSSFTDELSRPSWTYRAIANLQNIECANHPIALADGISIRGRSFDELSELLKWDQTQLEYLVKDWMGGASSSFVVLIEKEIPKTPENFLLQDDGSSFVRTARALLAMRLLAPGDLRIGKLFATRPAAFNVGIGGMSSQGFTVWHPGPTYHLTPGLVPQIKQLYMDISKLEQQADEYSRTILLALRSFSSIYDRLLHQAEDEILDAITALEALWRIDIELSFKLAFYTSSLLATSDDQRVSIFRTLKGYYDIRSRTVHGGTLTSAQRLQLHKSEPLCDIVRRALRAFVHLAVHPNMDWTLQRLYNEVNIVFLHARQRAELQAAMNVSSSGIA